MGVLQEYLNQISNDLTRLSSIKESLLTVSKIDTYIIEENVDQSIRLAKDEIDSLRCTQTEMNRLYLDFIELNDTSEILMLQSKDMLTSNDVPCLRKSKTQTVDWELIVQEEAKAFADNSYNTTLMRQQIELRDSLQRLSEFTNSSSQSMSDELNSTQNLIKKLEHSISRYSNLKVSYDKIQSVLESHGILT